MSFPEISRRCPACGASARAGAVFCPQCGRGLREGAPPRSDSATASSARQQLVPERPPLNTFADSPDGGQPRNAEAPAADGLNARASGESAIKVSAPNAEARAEGEKDAGRPRASRQLGILAVEETSGRGRGERLREASANVLDEAADDPGLRFVLIAFVLFILFLALLLLNSFVG